MPLKLLQGDSVSSFSSQVQDAKQYLQTELQHSQMLMEKLQEYSDRVKNTINQIDTAYETVFQRINSKEKLLCDKVCARALTFRCVIASSDTQEEGNRGSVP